MITTDKIKVVPVVFPQAIDDDDAPVGAFADGAPRSVDRQGFDHALVIVTLGETDIAVASLGVYSGPAAASGASDSTYALITGAALTGAALPSATDDNKLFGFSIDLRALNNRYLAVDIVMGNGSAGGFTTCHVLLTRGDEIEATAASMGFDTLVRVTA